MRPLDTSRLSHALRRLALVGTLLLYGASRADAEWYIGGYGGLSNPGAFSNVTLSDSTLAGESATPVLMTWSSKADSRAEPKGGYFFVNHPWLGLETDVFTLTPDVKTQMVLGGTSSGRVSADTLPRTPFD